MPDLIGRSREDVRDQRTITFNLLMRIDYHTSEQVGSEGRLENTGLTVLPTCPTMWDRLGISANLEVIGEMSAKDVFLSVGATAAKKIQMREDGPYPSHQ